MTGLDWSTPTNAQGATGHGDGLINCSVGQFDPSLSEERLACRWSVDTSVKTGVDLAASS